MVKYTLIRANISRLPRTFECAFHHISKSVTSIILLESFRTSIQPKTDTYWSVWMGLKSQRSINVIELTIAWIYFFTIETWNFANVFHASWINLHRKQDIRPSDSIEVLIWPHFLFNLQLTGCNFRCLVWLTTQYKLSWIFWKPMHSLDIEFLSKIKNTKTNPDYKFKNYDHSNLGIIIISSYEIHLLLTRSVERVS